MKRTILCALLMVLPAVPVRASEPEFDVEQPFMQVEAGHLLRLLLNQALDVLEDHVVVTGDLGRERDTGDRQGRLELRLYPKGKSKSDEHVTVEGWFRYSPESHQQDLHFRFQLPKNPPHQPHQSEDVL